jgi:P-type Cu2+ transporter
VLPGIRFVVVADGETKPVCCTGCQAAGAMILGQGLGDYYRLRETVAESVREDERTEDLDVYDDPEIQRGFVHKTGVANEAQILIEGIRCAACVWLNEQMVSRMPGVLSVDVNYATHRARIRWDPAQVRLSAILETIRAIGYRAHPYDPRHVDLVNKAEQRQTLWRLFVAGFGMMQVMMYAIPVYLADVGDMSWDIKQLFRWAGFILTLPVIFYSAAPFFRGAARDLRLRRLGMDVPVALGLAIAFGASVVATVAQAGEVYYDSIAMFVCLLLLGRYLELIARQRATRALQYLGRLVPAFAERLRGFPSVLDVERVPVTALRPGEYVIVSTGQQVPADGIVERGEGSVDDALLSGESRPVPKVPGDALIGGAVNLSHPLVMRVTSTGADTVLSGIVRLVERAVGEKHRLAVIADRTAGTFILAVLILSCIAAVYWAMTDPAKAVWVTVSVLVATCPCALSLAMPVALTASTGELARRGFVVTRAHTIEVLARATDMVLDKTGTLTRGEVRLIELVPKGRLSHHRCLQIAAALETGASHPIAAAIARAAQSAGPHIPAAECAQSFAGEGVAANIEGRQYRIGTPGFVARWAGAEPEASRDADAVLLGDESGVLAVLRFGDELRPDALHAVAVLKQLGLRLHLLTGDAEVSARDIAARVGIERISARARPADKQEYVRALQRGGAVVAMVGDGVNDAPVLAQADVSVAMGGGAHLAQAQGDAVLVSGRLDDLAWGVRHARKTLAVIRQNIAWAFAYNLVVLPFAFMGNISPAVAAIGMSSSSLLVVLNALRLVSRDRTFRSGQTDQIILAPA